MFPELEPVNPGVEAAPPSTLAPRRSAKRARLDGHLKATTISFRSLSRYGDLMVRYLEARKRVFIDSLHWNLPSVDDMEFDQYDTPVARWIVIHEFGEVLGGVRLMPTTARCGVYSYMLRDAQLGLLDPIPRDVLFLDAPVDPRVWEASRLFIADEVPAARRALVQSELMRQMARTAGELGASHVVCIVPAAFARPLRGLGLAAVPVGRRVEIGGTLSQAALFKVTRDLQ